MLSLFFTILNQDLLIAYRHRSDMITPLVFFVIVVSLFPLTMNPEPALLQKIAPSIIWIAALLSILLGLGNLFQADFLDGTLEQMLLSPYPLTWLVLAKILAHWLITSMPLIIMTPLLSTLFYLPTEHIIALTATLLIGTPTLNLIGAMGLALTVGLRNSGMLLALLILPLFIPVLIFGVGGVAAVNSVPFAWLGAILLLCLSFSPYLTGAALRLSTL